jgi:hypothetical protein
MDNKTKFFFAVLLTMGIYFVLTFPMFLAFFTMDINTGEYIGITYPTWLCVVIAITSAILGNLSANYIIKKYKL